MSTPISRLATAVVALTLAALPLGATAFQHTATPPYAAYDLSLVDDGPSRQAGAITGRLRICANDKGEIDGFFLSDNGGRDLTMYGSDDGSKVNVHTLSQLDGLDLYGTLQDGKIVGSGTIHEHPYTFVATLESESQHPATQLPLCRT